MKAFLEQLLKQQEDKGNTNVSVLHLHFPTKKSDFKQKVFDALIPLVCEETINMSLAPINNPDCEKEFEDVYGKLLLYNPLNGGLRDRMFFEYQGKRKESSICFSNEQVLESAPIELPINSEVIFIPKEAESIHYQIRDLEGRLSYFYNKSDWMKGVSLFYPSTCSIVNTYTKYFNSFTESHRRDRIYSLEGNYSPEYVTPVFHNARYKKAAELKKSISHHRTKGIVFFDRYPKGNSWLKQQGAFAPNKILVITFSPKRFYLNNAVQGLGAITRQIGPLECVKWGVNIVLPDPEDFVFYEDANLKTLFNLYTKLEEQENQERKENGFDSIFPIPANLLNNIFSKESGEILRAFILNRKQQELSGSPRSNELVVILDQIIDKFIQLLPTYHLAFKLTKTRRSKTIVMPSIFFDKFFIPGLFEELENLRSRFTDINFIRSRDLLSSDYVENNNLIFTYFDRRYLNHIVISDAQSITFNLNAELQKRNSLLLLKAFVLDQKSLISRNNTIEYVDQSNLDELEALLEFANEATTDDNETEGNFIDDYVADNPIFLQNEGNDSASEDGSSEIGEEIEDEDELGDEVFGFDPRRKKKWLLINNSIKRGASSFVYVINRKESLSYNKHYLINQDIKGAEIIDPTSINSSMIDEMFDVDDSQVDNIPLWKIELQKYLTTNRRQPEWLYRQLEIKGLSIRFEQFRNNWLRHNGSSNIPKRHADRLIVCQVTGVDIRYMELLDRVRRQKQNEKSEFTRALQHLLEKMIDSDWWSGNEIERERLHRHFSQDHGLNILFTDPEDNKKEVMEELCAMITRKLKTVKVNSIQIVNE